MPRQGNTPDVAALIRATACYLIVDRAGVRVIRDPYSAKPYILFYTTKRVGGGVQDFDAIKLLKFAVS
ncbi:MAG: hypothetical protein QOJ86_432 [Bradyrhizobium sp.]|jgi:HK97 family phage major capsid protein|nr:hypothetical protein [Bradyrhizobium sp.]